MGIVKRARCTFKRKDGHGNMSVTCVLDLFNLIFRSTRTSSNGYV